MKNNRAYGSMDSGFTKTAIATWLAVALSWTALAEEWTESVSSSNLASENIASHVQGGVTHVLGEYKNTRYDAKTNTIFLSEGTEELNEKRDAEKFFSIDLDAFNSVYEWGTEMFGTTKEITELLEKRDSFLQIQKNTHSFADLKTINEELLRISKDMTKAKEQQSVGYIEEVLKKIQQILPSYEEKIRYIERMNTENPHLTKFAVLLRGTLSDVGGVSAQTMTYKDISYIPNDFENKLVTKTSQVDRTAFSEEQLSNYKNRFIKLTDVHNAAILSKSINESNVLDYLADLNNDGKLSDNDTGIFFGKQLSSLLKETEALMMTEENDKLFYNNLSYIFELGGAKPDFSDAAGLVDFLQRNPLAKVQFEEALYRINITGTDIGFVLRFGSEGLKKWEKTSEEIRKNPLIGKLFAKVQDGVKNLGTEIFHLKEKGIITNQEYLRQIDMLQKTVNNPKFEEQILSQSLNLLSMITASYFSTEHGGVQASYSRAAVDMRVAQETKKFVDSMGLSTGIFDDNGKKSLIVGIVYEGTKQVSDTGALSFGIGVNFGFWADKNVLPVLSLGHISQTNMQEIENAGIADFDENTNRLKVGGSLSMTNTRGTMLGIGFKFNGEKKSAVEKKLSEYSQLLEGVFDCDTTSSLESCMQHIQNTITSEKYKKVSFLKDSLVEIERRLRMMNFDGMTPTVRAKMMQEEQAFYVTKFLNSQAANAKEKGWAVSGISLGISILAKIVGIPFIPGIEVSKSSMKHSPDQAKKTAERIISQDGIGTTTVLSKDDKNLGKNMEAMFGIKWLSISHENGRISLSSSSGWDILNLLSQNGVDVRLEISQKILSQVSYRGNVLVIGDISDISYFNAFMAEGKKSTLVLGSKGSSKTESLTPALAKILEGTEPTPLSKNIRMTRGTITPQQIESFHEEKVSIGGIF